MMRRHAHSCQMVAMRLIRPFCCLLAVLHPILHGTPFDGGVLDALMQYGLAAPDPIVLKEAE